MARQLDGLGPKALLAGLLMTAFRLGTWEDVIAFVYQGGKSHIAQAAALVEQIYAEGDTLAAEILEDNVQSLVELVAAAANRSDLRDPRLRSWTVCWNIIRWYGGFSSAGNVTKMFLEKGQHRAVKSRPVLPCPVRIYPRVGRRVGRARKRKINPPKKC